MSSEMKNEYFDSLGIKTKNQAFMYLQNGLEDASDFFIDFSLHSYVKEKYSNDNEIFIVLMWYVTFFPGNILLLQVYLKQFSSIISPSYYDKALFLQLHRVHVFRQSSAYKESESDYKKLHHYTDKLIAQYANIWRHIESVCDSKENDKKGIDDVIDDVLQKQESSPDKKINGDNFSIDDDLITTLSSNSKIDNLFEKATALRLNADLAWIESIGKYPNNSRFANEYSRYLLKARCRYKKGLKWKARAELLEQGKKLENDQMFYHFIKMYPRYIKKRIVDYEGAFISPENRKSSSVSSSDSILAAPLISTSSSISSSSNSSSSASYSYSNSSELTNDDEATEKDQLYISMERAVSVISSSNIKRILISALCRLVLTLVYCIGCFVLILSLFNDKDRFFGTFKYYAKATNYLNLAQQQIIWWYAKAFDNQIMTLSSISKSIGPAFYNYVDKFEINYTKYIFNISSIAIQAYTTMAYQTYKYSFSSSNELKNLTRFLSKTKIDNNFCLFEKKYETFPISFEFATKTARNSITTDFLIRNILLSMMNLSFQNEKQRSEWSANTEFCTFVYHHWDVFEMITEVTKRINPLFDTVINCYIENNFSSPYLFSETNKSIEYFIKSIDKYNSSIEELSPDDSSCYLDFVSNLIVALTPIICMALILPLIIFLSVGVNQEWQSYLGILRKFSPGQIEKAISKSTKSKYDKYNDKTLLIQDMSKREMPSWVPNVISSLIVIFALLLLALLSRSQVQDINHMMMQFSLITQFQNTLFSMATDLVFLLHMKVIEGETELEKYLSFSNFTYHINRQIDILTMTYNIIRYGGYNLPSNIGKRTEFYDVLYKERCQPNYHSKYPIEYYNCISFENLVHYYTKLLKTIYNAHDQYSLKSDTVVNIAFLTRTRLLDDSLEIFDKCEEVYLNQKKVFVILTIVFLFIACIACIVAFIFDICIIGRVKNTIETFKDLTLRIDPIDFVTNEKIISLIYGKNRTNNPKLTSATHALFFTSKYGMMYVNKNLIIEDINPATSSIFGFTADQMVGQHVSVFIPEKLEENEDFYAQMKLMMEGQRSLTLKDEVIAITDNGLQAPLITTLLGICPNPKDYKSKKGDASGFNGFAENGMIEDKEKVENEKNKNNSNESVFKSNETEEEEEINNKNQERQANNNTTNENKIATKNENSDEFEDSKTTSESNKKENSINAVYESSAESENNKKERNEKESNEKESNEKESNEKESNEKESNEKESNEKESNEKESNEKESNEKERNEKESNEKESNEKESNEKESNVATGSENNAVNNNDNNASTNNNNENASTNNNNENASTNNNNNENARTNNNNNENARTNNDNENARTNNNNNENARTNNNNENASTNNDNENASTNNNNNENARTNNNNNENARTNNDNENARTNNDNDNNASTNNDNKNDNNAEKDKKEVDVSIDVPEANESSNDKGKDKDNESSIRSSRFVHRDDSHGRQFAEAFNIIFEDKSEESNAKASLEKAQKQSQSFLTKMFPQPLLTRMNHVKNRDETITFDVNMSSISFIDIDKFTSFVDPNSPAVSLQNIKTIVKTFDTLLNKYFLLTKVKVFGDCYMVASGLFNSEISPSVKANQSLLFCFDCIDSIEDLNINLNTNLQVRVGIHTGGPIVAGVFGSEKPVFDIIGEPIQTAFLLQKNGKPGNVHISQDTYDLVATNPFQFENGEKIDLDDGKTLNTFNVFRKRLTLGSYSRSSSYFSSFMHSQKSDSGISMSMSAQLVNTDNLDLVSPNSPKLLIPFLSDSAEPEVYSKQMINLAVSESDEIYLDSTIKRKPSDSYLADNQVGTSGSASSNV
ncbi:hypothetical protein M9Y10_034801 [Tritrichomonas musculus]|uniref:adenylate cyclase n=1 Tax=Tritrichomonas musculus TaxID=1915356 RepID=A0ABR2KHZ5_9EUKA